MSRRLVITLAPAPPSRGTLQVTGGDFTLLRSGHQTLAITDGVSPVSGCTIATSDATKCSVWSGYTVQGNANSGTCTLTISKVGYVSTTVTVTCSALNFRMDAALGTNTTTNAAAVNSWADQNGGGTFVTGAGTATYATNSMNGQPGITFDGTASALKDTSQVAALNVATLSVFAIVKPNAAGDGRASARTILNNATSNAGGIFLRMNSSNFVELLVESGTTQASVDSSPTTYTGGAGQYITALIANGSQTLRVGGATVKTGSNVFNASGAPCGIGAVVAGTSSFFYGDIDLILASSRIWTAAEYGQLELMARDLYAL